LTEIFSPRKLAGYFFACGFFSGEKSDKEKRLSPRGDFLRKQLQSQ
jgi:hypothetical protein